MKITKQCYDKKQAPRAVINIRCLIDITDLNLRASRFGIHHTFKSGEKDVTDYCDAIDSTSKDKLIEERDRCVLKLMLKEKIDLKKLLVNMNETDGTVFKDYLERNGLQIV
jgi:hypothetical protein